MLGLGLGLHRNTYKKKYILDKVKGAVASYSLFKLRSGTPYAIRVRRSLDSLEKDIGFAGGSLDVASLMEFTQPNLLANYPLGVDNNSDGVSDGWTGEMVGTATSSFSIEDNAQKINVTLSSSSPALIRQFITYNSIVSGDVINVSAMFKGISNNGFLGRISVLFKDSSNNTVGSISASSFIPDLDYTKKSFLGIVAPSNTAKVVIYLGTEVPNGASGIVWIKDCILQKIGSAYITAQYDESGNINTATQTTVSNQPCIVKDGVLQQGVLFDGVDDCLSISNSDSLDITNAPLSISAVVYPSTSGGGYVICKNLDSASNIQYGFNVDNATGNNYTYPVLENTILPHTGTNSVPANTYSHVVTTWDGVNSKTYVNGILKITTTKTGTLTSRPNVTIGARVHTGGTKLAIFKGNIDMLIVSNKLYSTQDIAKLYAEAKKKYPSLP